MLVPKLVTTLKTYNRRQFAADLTAGVIVGIVALPLAIAFAIASGLTVATIMAGLMLIAFGLAKLGAAIKFIPFPVVTGFTSGIAVILMVQQLRDVLGLRLATAPPEFIERLSLYAANLGTTNPYAVGISAVTLLIIRLWPRVSHRVPAPFVALMITTV